jgi:ATP-dependent Clp protease protease subunit
MLEVISERTIVLKDTIRPVTAAATVGRIIELAGRDADDIFLCIDCSGGDVKSGLAIYEAIQLAPCDVVTLCFGTAASMAALLLATGTARKRFAVPHGRILVHEPMLLDRGFDPDAALALMVELKETMDTIMLRHIGRSWRQLQEAQGTAPSLTAAAALKLGVIDNATLEVRIR